MRNYILLGIGIGMIISGSIFTFFDNRQYSQIEQKVREEIMEEMSKEKIFEDIEEEFSSIVEDKKEDAVEEKKVEEKEEENEEKAEKIIKEEEKSISKFYPLKGEENIYSIQFRSSSEKEDVIKVEETLNSFIDTRIEFIQGYYRLFAKDLYSKEYSEMIAYEIKKEFSLNPIVRSPKQMDYLVLGPKKYNEKYNIVDEKVEETQNILNITNDEEIKKEAKEEKSEDSKIENTVKKEEAVIKEKEEISRLDKDNQKEINKEKIEDTSEIKMEKVEEISKVEKIDAIDEISQIENKNTKLIFIESGTKLQADFIENNIKDLMELKIEEKNGAYTIESKEYFAESVADDIVSKLNLLFNMDIKKIDKED